MNSFQKWADSYARAFGFVVTLKGNWVDLHKDGETVECMSAQGVLAACRPIGGPAPRYRVRRCNGNRAYWCCVPLRADGSEIEVFPRDSTGTREKMIAYARERGAEPEVIKDAPA